MLSIQAWVVKWICRFFVKRALMKPSSDPLAAIRALRWRLSLYDPLNRRFTRGCEIGEALGPVRGEWIVPPRAPSDRAILYIHGGAFVACSPLTHRRLTTALAKKSQCPVFALRYRLAPEHPFPAALDDALAAYDMLRARGIPSRHIVIAGDSAGGNLALATTLALTQRPQLEPLGGTLAFSPWTDLLATGSTLVTNDAKDDMLVGTGVRDSARSYARSDADLHNPLASPLYGDLHGFPTTLLWSGSTEVLLDDSVRFVGHAKAAGVDATLQVRRGMPHVWQIFYDVMPEARRSVHESAAWIRAVLARADSGSSTFAASSGRG